MAAPTVDIPEHPNSPSFSADITPSDSTRFPPTRGLYIGGSGNLVVEMAGDGGATRTYKNVVGGYDYSRRVVRVLAATTATDIVAMW